MDMRDVKWIDLRERQPEEGQRVLFTRASHRAGGSIIPNIGSYEPDFGGFYCSAQRFIGTHWLPLDVLPELEAVVVEESYG